MTENTGNPCSSTVDRDRRADWIALAIATATWALAAWLTTRTTLFDRDEPRFGRSAVEMVASGNWLYPTLNGELRPDKPIFIYWLMALFVQCFGLTAWAVRAASPIALAASSYVVYRAGRSLFGARTGLLAQTMLALSPLALMEGTVATTDAVLLFFATSATWHGFVLFRRQARARDIVILGGLLGLGLLTKGPVALALPLCAWIATFWIARRSVPDLDRKRWRAHALAACIGVVLFLAWAIPANIATHGEFAARGLGHHVLDRTVSPMEGHGGNFLVSLPFYAPVIVLGVLPWTIVLAGAATTFFRRGSLEPWPRAVVIGWSVATVVLMTLVATKLPHYVLPAWPGIALAMAAHVDRGERGLLDARERTWLRRGSILYAALLAVIVPGAWFAPHALGLPTARSPLLGCALIWIVTGAMGIASGMRGHWIRAASTLAFGALAAWIWVGLAVLPELERIKPAARMAQAITTRTDASVPIAMFHYREPSLAFYVGERNVEVLPDIDAVRAWMNKNGPRVLVLPDIDVEVVVASSTQPAWHEIAREHGFNFSKGRPLELVVLAR